MAAEYPSTLCEALAAEYFKWKNASLKPTYTTIDALGTHALGDRESKKQIRAAENNAAIGGMRTPHLSVSKVPGWKPVGARIRSILNEVLQRHSKEETQVLEDMGKEDAAGWSDAVIQEARRKLE